VRLSIRAKLVVPLVMGLSLIAVATWALMRFVHQRAVDQAALREVARAEEALDAQRHAEVDRLAALLDALAGDDSLAEALARRDRAALLAEAAPLFERLRAAHGITQWYFHDPDPARGVLLRVHRPELFGDLVDRPTLRRAVETGQEESGSEFGRTAFAVRVVRPWTWRGALIGYVELGTDVHTWLERLKRSTGDDYGMLLDKRRLDPAAWAQVSGEPGSWNERPGLLAIAATAGRALVFGDLGRPEEIPAVASVVGRVADGRRTLARGLFPLHGGDGATVGGVVVLHDITPLLSGGDEVGLRVVLLVVLLAAALAALVVFLLESLVFERIERMSRSLEGLPERLARGEYGPPEVAPRRDDELGRFEAFLDRAVASIGSFVAEARRAPTGRHRAVRPTERDL
jgi:hypothetical protein